MAGKASIYKAKSHYLNRVESERERQFAEVSRSGERRRSPRQKCHLFARVCFTTRGIRGFEEVLVHLVDISQHGVRLLCRRPQDLPLFFHLYIGQYQYGMGCMVVSRSRDMVRCEFFRVQMTPIVDFLATVNNPYATLYSIRHPLFSRQSESRSSLAARLHAAATPSGFPAARMAGQQAAFAPPAKSGVSAAPAS